METPLSATPLQQPSFSGYLTSSLYDDFIIFLVIMVMIILLIDSRWLTALLVLVIVLMLLYRPHRETKTLFQIEGYESTQSFDFNPSIRAAIREKQVSGQTRLGVAINW